MNSGSAVGERRPQGRNVVHAEERIRSSRRGQLMTNQAENPVTVPVSRSDATGAAQSEQLDEQAPPDM